MMNFSRGFIIILFTLILNSAHAQDTIITWKKKYIPARIISLNRSTLQYVPWNDTTGEIKRRPISELRKIKYESGEIVNLNNWQKQAGLGLTYFIFPKAFRYMDNGKYEESEVYFKSSGVLLSYFYRGHIVGLVISAGYARTSFQYTSHEFSIITGASEGISESLVSNNFTFQFTPRLYTNIRKVSPFFDVMIGLEFYSNPDSLGITGDVPPFIEPGFGIQFRLFRSWMGEVKAGICRRSELKNTDLNFIPEYRISFYRIYSHLSRI